MENYNFVVFGSDFEYYFAAYSDLKNADFAEYINPKYIIKNKLLRNIFRFHVSPKINKKIKLPLQKVWFPLIYKNKFDNKNPICFIFFAEIKYVNAIKNGYIEYLRRKYKNSKFVLYTQDLIEKNINIKSYGRKEEFFNKFDLLISFDERDAKKYNMKHFPLVYSSPTNDEIDKTEIKNDIYFLGFAKNRLNDIINAYEVLSSAGLKCDFNIVRVPEEEQLYADKINYCKMMPYKENIKHIKQSNCILEIMQKNGYGYTGRMCEAIAYNKKLLSNNKNLINMPFYNEKLISVFDDANDIDIDFVKGNNQNINYDYKNKISPLRLLEFIENELGK